MCCRSQLAVPKSLNTFSLHTGSEQYEKESVVYVFSPRTFRSSTEILSIEVVMCSKSPVCLPPVAHLTSRDARQKHLPSAWGPTPHGLSTSIRLLTSLKTWSPPKTSTTSGSAPSVPNQSPLVSMIPFPLSFFRFSKSIVCAHHGP
jgi:hypothetical protein